MTVIDYLFTAAAQLTVAVSQLTVAVSQLTVAVSQLIAAIPPLTPAQINNASNQLNAARDDRKLPIIDSIKKILNKILKKIQEDPQILDVTKAELETDFASLEKLIYNQLTQQQQLEVEVLLPKLQILLSDLQKKQLSPQQQLELLPELLCRIQRQLHYERFLPLINELINILVTISNQ